MAASEALQLGHGGISQVSRACGLSRVTITKAVQELDAAPLPPGRLRRAGAGRRKLEAQDPKLLHLLESLVEPLTRGDPESPLRWTCKSTRALAAALTAQDHPISHEKVAQLLRQMGYSLQSNRKTEEGQDHADRDAQFLHLNQVTADALAEGKPVISVDTKKKELIGNYKNAGQQWREQQSPESVRCHEFPAPSVPRAYPYGIYDLGRNRASSMWAPIMTPALLPWPPSAAGGAMKAVGFIPRRTNWSSRLMGVAAMAIGCVGGKWNYRNSPMRRG